MFPSTVLSRPSTKSSLGMVDTIFLALFNERSEYFRCDKRYMFRTVSSQIPLGQSNCVSPTGMLEIRCAGWQEVADKKELVAIGFLYGRIVSSSFILPVMRNPLSIF